MSMCCRRRGRGGQQEAEPQIWRFSTGLHSPESDLRYADPQPALFSFNSAYGACEVCRGFGRVIGVDLGLVIPDARKTLRDGAIKPMQTPAWKECQDDLMRYAAKADIRRGTPWGELTRRGARLGHQRLAGLERQVAKPVVRRQALLRLSGIEGVQDAYSRAAVQVPQLYAVRNLRRRAPENRIAAVAPRHARRKRTTCCRPASASCRAASTGRARSSKRCRA